MEKEKRDWKNWLVLIIGVILLSGLMGSVLYSALSPAKSQTITFNVTGITTSINSSTLVQTNMVQMMK